MQQRKSAWEFTSKDPSNQTIPDDIALVCLFLTYLSNSFSSFLEVCGVEGCSSRSLLTEAKVERRRAGAVQVRFRGSIMYSVSGMLWLTRDMRCLISSTSACLWS